MTATSDTHPVHDIVLQQTRIETIKQSIKTVCPACGARAFPRDRDYHLVHGPNDAGNYVHRPQNGSEELCKATALWTSLQWEERKLATLLEGPVSVVPTEAPVNSPSHFRDNPSLWEAWLAGARWLATVANDIEGWSEYQIGDRALCKLNLLPKAKVRKRESGRLQFEMQYLRRKLANQDAKADAGTEASGS